jgi:predicted acyltransferase
VAVPKNDRILAVDAYRGFVMLAMASGGLGIATVAEKSFPENMFWQALAHQFSHVEWGGCTFWDLIQPSFMFMVGVAMPFSYTARKERGDSWWELAGHALLRALVLIILGVMLSSRGHSMTHFDFQNVLAQIGLGYFFVFLLLGLGRWIQFLAALAILGGTWWLFWQHPIMDASAVNEMGITSRWEYYTGDAAHWNKNTNYAAHFDRWFLNLFPREKSFVEDRGGYHTLNFLPSMATMLFGVLAGSLLSSYRSSAGWKFMVLVMWGLAFLGIGVALDRTLIPKQVPVIKQETPVMEVGFQGRPFADPAWSICPAVKRIWTPTWAVFSTGWTLLMLALFYGFTECAGFRWWAFPFAVVGMNSIVMYMLSQWTSGWILETLRLHFGGLFTYLRETQHWYWLTGPYTPIAERCVVLLCLWLFVYWLYRQKAFLRI